MKQFGTGLSRIVLAGIFLLAALAGLPAILSAIVPTLPEVGTTEEASGATAGAGYAAAFDDDAMRAAYEEALAGRARLDFHPQFTAEGDSLTGWFWPAWLVSVFKTGASEWAASVGAFFVPERSEGQLVISLERSLLNQDILLELQFYDGGPAGSGVNGPGGYLFVELINADGETLSAPDGEKLSSARYGNLLGEGSGEQILTKAMLVPLEDNPEAVGIRICARGEVFVLGVALLVKESGTLSSDEVTDQPTAHRAPSARELRRARDDSPYRLPAGRLSEVGRGVSAEPVVSSSGRVKPKAGLRARPVKAVTLAQFLMSDERFIMTRAALSGGGGRQTSESLILENTFGQSSTIGFSYGTGVTLHWGFQQAEVERIAAQVTLKPEVLNVNPGILTAFVRLPEGYPVSGIASAICEGALPERMMPNDDGTEMIMKFRRQTIEAALAEQGEVLDTHFVVEGIWQGAEGAIPFAGEDDIARIVN